MHVRREDVGHPVLVSEDLDRPLQPGEFDNTIVVRKRAMDHVIDEEKTGRRKKRNRESKDTKHAYHFPD